MQSNNNFPTLGPIIIGTKDIEKAKKFYISTFGLVIENESPNYVSAHGIDGTHIELEEDSENRFPNWKIHNVGTYKNSEFVVQDINLFLKNVEDNGGQIITQATPRPWGGFGAEIADPEGNMFLISQK